MSQDNHITLRGYLTAEPKFKQTANMTVPLTELRVGSTPRRLNRETGEWQDQPTSYYRVKCWRRLAINASSSLHKGDMVLVRGRFYTNTWTDNQQRQRSEVEIEADTLGHDLSYGWSHFLRGTRTSPGSQAGVNAGEMARQDLDPAGRDAGRDGSDEDYPSAGDLEELPEAAFASDGQSGADYPWHPGGPVEGPAETAGLAVTDGDEISEPEDALLMSDMKGDSELSEVMEPSLQ